MGSGMTTLVTSTNLVFLNGRRYRPGEAFEVPMGMTLAPGMKRLTTSEDKVIREVKPASPKRHKPSDKTNAPKAKKRKRASDQGT